MKTLLVFLGLTFLMSGTVIVARRGLGRWSYFYAGISAMLGALLVSSTPLPNGSTFRVENGQFIPVP